MSQERKEVYMRFCACIEDLIKLKECDNCPHHNSEAIKLENECSYSKSEINDDN